MPRRLLRAIAGAVANAQRDIDARTIAAAAPRRYRIAELVLEYSHERTLFRVTSPVGRAEFLAELVIDGRCEEALVIPIGAVRERR